MHHELPIAKGDPWELYDLKTDRAEQHNLASKLPDKAQELADAWQKQTDDFIALVQTTVAEQPQTTLTPSLAK